MEGGVVNEDQWLGAVTFLIAQSQPEPPAVDILLLECSNFITSLQKYIEINDNSHNHFDYQNLSLKTTSKRLGLGTNNRYLIENGTPLLITNPKIKHTVEYQFTWSLLLSNSGYKRSDTWRTDLSRGLVEIENSTLRIYPAD